MLVVENRVHSEQEIPISRNKPSDFIWPHGITPPLRNVRKRRFRRALSHRTIETVENEVNRLLKLDAQAEKTQFEVVDRLQSRQASVSLSDVDSPAQYDTPVPRAFQDPRSSFARFNLSDMGKAAGQPGEDEEDTNLFEQELEQMMTQGRQDTSTGTPGFTPRETGTGADNSSAGSGEDDDNAHSEVDEMQVQNTVQQAMEKTLHDEEIADILASIESSKQSAAKATNPLLRDRFLARVSKLQSDLELMQSEDVDDTGDEGDEN